MQTKIIRVAVVMMALLSGHAAQAGEHYVLHAGKKAYLYDIRGCRGNPDLGIALLSWERDVSRALACWRYRGDKIILFPASTDEPTIEIDRSLERFDPTSEAPELSAWHPRAPRPPFPSGSTAGRIAS